MSTAIAETLEQASETNEWETETDVIIIRSIN